MTHRSPLSDRDKQIQLTPQERIIALLEAPPEVLRQCDLLLSGKTASHSTEGSLRLMTFKEASDELGVGRSTIERLVDEGRLPTVALRKGRRRIRREALQKLVNGEFAFEAE